MTPPPDSDDGLRGIVRRAAGGARNAADNAFDATVGRVGHSVGEAALDATNATAQQVIEDLEPYLIEEAIPRIVAGITPYLTDEVVPEVLAGITDHLTTVTIPEVVDGVTGHLVESTVPEVVAGVTPRLVDDLLPRLLADLQPYLEQQLVPHIVDGLVPHLEQTIAPGLIDSLMPKLGEEVAPRLVDTLMPRIQTEIAPQLVDALMPKIRDQVAPDLLEALMPRIQTEIAPQLVDALMPKIRDQVAPDLLEALMPRIQTEIAPQLVDALMPKIRDQVAPDLLEALMPRIQTEIAPQLVDALMPKIRDQVAPDLLEALMPRIQTEIAPQLVDALMPKIRKEVVPQILDDIVDDPRIRDLIREQSQGLFLDAIEGFRGTLADVDSLVDRLGRRWLRRPPRPVPESAVQLVLADTSPDDTKPVRLAVEDLSKQRAAWRALPAPPAPPGRTFTYAGAVTRLLGLAIDIFVVGYLITVLFSTLGSFIDSLFDGSPPEWLNLTFLALAASVIPMYLGLCYWALGRSLGMGIVGIRVCTPDGRRPGFLRAIVRAWLGMIGMVFWIMTAFISLFDSKRRSLLDLLAHTEVRYSVPETQQRRHVRDAVQEQRAEAPQV